MNMQNQLKKSMDELKNYVYVSIISADNDEFGLSEEDKQEIISRHNLGSTWEYILEPIKDVKVRKSLIEFFEEDGSTDTPTEKMHEKFHKRNRHAEIDV